MSITQTALSILGEAPGPSLFKRPLLVSAIHLETEVQTCYRPVGKNDDDYSDVEAIYGTYQDPFEATTPTPSQYRVREERRNIARMMRGSEALFPFASSDDLTKGCLLSEFCKAFLVQVKTFEEQLTSSSIDQATDVINPLSACENFAEEVLPGLQKISLKSRKYLTLSDLTAAGRQRYVEQLIRYAKGQSFLSLLDKTVAYHVLFYYQSIEPTMLSDSRLTCSSILKSIVSKTGTGQDDLIESMQRATIEDLLSAEETGKLRQPSGFLAFSLKESLKAASLISPKYDEIGLLIQGAENISRLMFNMNDLKRWYYRKWQDPDAQEERTLRAVRMLLVAIGLVQLPQELLVGNNTMGTFNWKYGGELPWNQPQVNGGPRTLPITQPNGFQTLQALVGQWVAAPLSREQCKDLGIPLDEFWLEPEALAKVTAMVQEMQDILETDVAVFNEYTVKRRSKYQPQGSISTGLADALKNEKIMTPQFVHWAAVGTDIQDQYLSKLPHLREKHYSSWLSDSNNRTTFPEYVYCQGETPALLDRRVGGTTRLVSHGFHYDMAYRFTNQNWQLEQPALLFETSNASYFAQADWELQVRESREQIPQNGVNQFATPAVGNALTEVQQNGTLRQRVYAAQDAYIYRKDLREAIIEQVPLRTMAEQHLTLCSEQTLDRYRSYACYQYQLLAEQLPHTYKERYEVRSDDFGLFNAAEAKIMFRPRVVNPPFHEYLPNMIRGKNCVEVGPLKARLMEATLKNSSTMKGYQKEQERKKISAEIYTQAKKVVMMKLSDLDQEVKTFIKARNKKQKELVVTGQPDCFKDARLFFNASKELYDSQKAKTESLIRLLCPDSAVLTPMLNQFWHNPRWPSSVAWYVAMYQLSAANVNVAWPPVVVVKDSLTLLLDALSGTQRPSEESLISTNRKKKNTPSPKVKEDSTTTIINTNVKAPAKQGAGKGKY